MTAKDKILSMRISESDKQMLSRAANLLGINLTSFVLQSAMNRSHEVLENEKRIVLTKGDLEKLIDILDSTAPNKNLMAAFADYKQTMK